MGRAYRRYRYAVSDNASMWAAQRVSVFDGVDTVHQSPNRQPSGANGPLHPARGLLVGWYGLPGRNAGVKGNKHEGSQLRRRRHRRRTRRAERRRAQSFRGIDRRGRRERTGRRECSYWACVPSKALLRPVFALADARRIDGAREAVTGSVDTDGVFGRRDRYVTNWDDSGQADWVKATGAELVRGHARLDGPRRVAVSTPENETVVIAAGHAVSICVGSGAALPDLPGVAEVRPWTNRQATESSSVPNRLAIIGGGGVAVEMATAWQGLGSSVTLLARGSGLLPRMESFVGELVGRGLRAAGADVRVGVSVTKLCRPLVTGPVTLEMDDGSELEVDEVMFATGRAPLTGDIGLDTVGLVPGSWLDVDDSCRVRGVHDGWLYAVGDANHRALLTHQGKYQARIAAAAIGARAAGRPLDSEPWVVIRQLLISRRYRRSSSPTPKQRRSAYQRSKLSRPAIGYKWSTSRSAK